MVHKQNVGAKVAAVAEVAGVDVAAVLDDAQDDDDDSMIESAVQDKLVVDCSVDKQNKYSFLAVQAACVELVDVASVLNMVVAEEVERLMLRPVRLRLAPYLCYHNYHKVRLMLLNL